MQATSSPLSRRDFLCRAAVTGAAAALPWPSPAQAPAPPKCPLVVFSKAFQHLDFTATAALIADAGYDGIECPVRKGGQVLPERVEEDLPKLVEALKQKGKFLEIATTDIREVTPLNEKVLRTAAKLGIRRYRLGESHYDLAKPIPPQLAEIKSRLKDLTALNRELGICAGFQNHSGANYIGAPVWDIYELIRDLDPAAIGIFFDIAHATIEGGYAWGIHAKLMEPRFQAVYIKDFTWAKTTKGWTAQWCPVGQGMIHPTFAARLAKSNFSGPISHHFEYEIGRDAEMERLIKADFRGLKRWLAGQSA
jgi:sugar phosphate isomerase/epimerase